MSELSILELIGELCEASLGPVQRAYQVQPTVSRPDSLKRLKKTAYNALFSYLGKRTGSDEGRCQVLKPEEEGILQEIDRLCAHGLHKDADKLNILFGKLSDEQYSSYLRFLVALRGSSVSTSQPHLGVDTFGSVTSVTRKPVSAKNEISFFSMPPSYGDDEHQFMQYPREVFETLFASVELTQEKELNMLFCMKPGKGLGQGGFFTQKFLIEDQHEQTSHRSLFGGLVQGSVDDINSLFDFPDISSSPSIRIPEFKTKKSISSSQLSDESGVGSGSVSMSSSVMTLPSEQSELEPWFWVDAFKAPRSHYYTWEWVGYGPEPTEKPYLTEAGPAMFDLLIHYRRRVMAIVCPSPDLAPPALVTVQPAVLVKDILKMLTGVPSLHLPFDATTMSFEVCDGLHISGTSPDILADFLDEFTNCGTLYTRLASFTKPPVINSFYTGGLVFQAFTVAVRKVLTQFQGIILNTPLDMELLQLRVYLHSAMNLIQYLAKLCQCDNGLPRPPTGKGGGGGGDAENKENSNFPTGMKLLSYLYDEVEIAVNSSHYPLLLSILQTTCAPFVLFIRDWVFHGVLRDSYEEFMIKVDAYNLGNRDESYWSLAYTLDTQSTVPHFLRGIVEDIVTCGKSINLLKLCCPQHFLCNISAQQVPSIYITYSKEVLQAMELDCQAYVGRMQRISEQLVDDRAEMMRKAEVARVELQQTARRMADREIARLQGILDERKRRDQARKRVEFARLKQQMEEDLRRRAGEKEAEKEEDAKLMARITREEYAMTEEEIELERRAREELVEYYTSLGEEAAHRERLALWKIQRARLSIQREQFLEEDAHFWGQELRGLREFKAGDKPGGVHTQSVQGGAPDIDIQEERVKDSGPLDSDYPDSRIDGVIELPHWAQRQGAGDMGPPLEVSDHEEITLPAWAARELPTTIEDEEEEEEEVEAKLEEVKESGVHLPSWVLREAGDGAGDTTLVIEDESDNEGRSETSDWSDAGKTVSGNAPEGEESNPKNESRPVDFQQEQEEKASSDAPNSNLGRQLRAVQIGGSPLPKPHVKTSSAAHSSLETEETEVKSSIQKVQGRHCTDESPEETLARPHLKQVPGAGVSGQSEEAVVRAHIKTLPSVGATKESEPEDTNTAPHIKFIEGVDVNMQTTQERNLIPRKGKGKEQKGVSEETLPKVWVIKKPSLFGHASQLSGSEYVLTVPKLKRQVMQHANTESEYKDFGIKPRIRISKSMSATQESSTGGGPAKSRPHIRMVEGRSSHTESHRVDENEVARRRFRTHNTKGHASDSSIQHLLYGDARPSRWAAQPIEEEAPDGPVPKVTFTPGLPYQATTFETEFDHLSQEPCVDLMGGVMLADLGRDLVDSAVASEEEIEAYKYTPLSVLLTRSVTAPIKAQISLVNSAVVNYFTSELRIDDHFVAIRRYLLMADGDFSEILANILFEKLSNNPLPQEIFNPVFLNGALTKAVRSSIHSDDELMRNLSFALNRMPSVLMANSPSSLSCLELRYSVQWPLNVILTTTCMRKYCKIFGFLLQIKRVVWTLKDVWHRLKRDALVVRGAARSPQFRHFQLHRQEMEHFVKAVQRYVTSQVIHVSWKEFQTELSQPVAGLSELQTRHKRYVEKALTKCLLDKKAAKVMKIIQDICSLILKFRSQLVSANWHTAAGGLATHPNFEAIVQTHKSFHVYSFFLFKVVNRLSQKGYQPHLQDLLLQLNFNDFYREAAT